jgi:DNA repair protein RadA/Sms
MAVTSAFVCQTCGGMQTKWSGKCDACGEWNTLVEEAVGGPPGSHGAAAIPKPSKTRGRKPGLDFVPLEGARDHPERHQCGISEFDRVLGGGFVPGSALLLGGDPGIGKSTLLLQVAARLASAGISTAYISGEEAVDQIRSRAMRLGVEKAPLQLAAETGLAPILQGLRDTRPQLVIIDSIQTMWSDTQPAAPGSVAQVRVCAQELVRFAKKANTIVVLVGHVTKEGQVAGPRVVEHVVDAVLYFEGERGHNFRILRGVKNRFGPTDEIGIFDMGEKGLVEVLNPSELFLSGRGKPSSGSVVFAGVEGVRPVLVEVQALVAPAAFGTPRRAVIGWDSSRLAMVLAVLEARCGFSLANKDVYLNIAGGLKVSEPAADLAVAAALISAADDIAIDQHCAAFGEISLSGDIRPVSRAALRLKEAAKLGFNQVMVPSGVANSEGGLRTRTLDTVADLIRTIQNAD